MRVWADLRGVKRLARESATVKTAGYAAFISYSHAADGRLAPAVQRGLEWLIKPWYRRRALRVFRDDSGLGVTPALWSTIAAALDQSDYLIVLASPDAARSQWVDREIEYWKADKPVERILLVITEGECCWDTARGDFDADSIAVPPSLVGVFAEEPRWLDLRWARSETQLDLRHSRFRAAIAQLAAPIHGRPRDDLESEDIYLHRRALRTAWSGVATLVVLLVMALIAGAIAVSNAHRADQQTRFTRARELAARATATRDQQPLSLLLSLESLRLGLTDEARDTLLQGILEPRHNAVALTVPNGVVNGVAFSPDGKTVASANADGTVRRWDVATGQQLGSPLTGHTDQVLAVAFNPDGKMIASASQDLTLRRWDVATGRQLGQPLTGHTLAVARVAFSPDGKMIASASQDSTLRRWDVATGQQLGQPLAGDRSPIKGVVFSPDGSMIVSGGDDGVVRRWDVTSGRQLGQPLAGHAKRILGVAFNPNGEMISSVGDDMTVRRWDAVTGQALGQPLVGHTSTVWDVEPYSKPL